MKIYLSGPISGLPDLNRPAFAQAASHLRALGWLVVSPHELEHRHGRTWVDYMREDLAAMMTADALLMLPGWEDSRGARLELTLARDLEMRIYYRLEDAWLVDMGARGDAL